MTRSTKLRLAAFLVIILMFVAGGWLSMSSRSTATYVATVGIVLPILLVVVWRCVNASERGEATD